MSKDRLTATSDYYGQWRLAWYLSEDDDFGACLGDDGVPDRRPEPRGDYEHYLATWVAARTRGVQQDSDGLYWESKTQAQAALRAVNAGLKAARDARPLPDWAREALAAGWRAPKGWQP